MAISSLNGFQQQRFRPLGNTFLNWPVEEPEEEPGDRELQEAAEQRALEREAQQKQLLQRTQQQEEPVRIVYRRPSITKCRSMPCYFLSEVPEVPSPTNAKQSLDDMSPARAGAKSGEESTGFGTSADSESATDSNTDVQVSAQARPPSTIPHFAAKQEGGQEGQAPGAAKAPAPSPPSPAKEPDSSRQQQPAANRAPGGGRVSSPKEQAPAAAEKGGEAQNTITTLMIRNLPSELQQSDLAAELDKTGFKGLYDFLYMPSSFGTCRGKGYAFVNFCLPAAAQMFADLWHNSRRFEQMCPEGTSLNVSAACIQGRDANIARWDTSKMRRIRSANHRPLIVMNASENVAANTATPLEPATASATAANAPGAVAASRRVARGARKKLQDGMPSPTSQVPVQMPMQQRTQQLPVQRPPQPPVQRPPQQMQVSSRGDFDEPFGTPGLNDFRQGGYNDFGKAPAQSLIGEWRVLTGLVRTPQFNGRWGLVEAYDPMVDRYIVRVAVDPDSDMWFLAKLLAENLAAPS